MSDRDAGPPPILQRGPRVTIQFDGDVVSAQSGETVAAALLAAGHRVLRRSPRHRSPRGIFCGTGDCFECLIRCDGEVVRACRHRVADGMEVSTWQDEEDR
jgi:predicted molibdopterin-dependent oxidoreductase YjgC